MSLKTRTSLRDQATFILQFWPVLMSIIGCALYVSNELATLRVDLSNVKAQVSDVKAQVSKVDGKIDAVVLNGIILRKEDTTFVVKKIGGI